MALKLPWNSRDRESQRPSTRSEYRVYKRRFWGLAQLVLLNIVVSWDWLTFSALSTTSAEYFNVSESAINWMSTGYLFAFCVASPVVIFTLNKGGPRPAIITTSSLLLLGNWIRYAGAKAQGGMYGVAMFGQILTGFAQPFCLSAPTRYSDLWFTDRGRISATAVATLANPLGAAIGQLVDPFWASKPNDIPSMVLYISIIATVASIPSFFIPSKPPTPPSASAAAIVEGTPLLAAVVQLLKTLEFWLILIPFTVYVGFFNSVSSLLNQILSPYGFSENDAGIAGAILIVVGLVCAAVISPITDRFKHYLGTIRILVPAVAASYIGLIFAPSSPAGIAPMFVVCAIMGASSFALLPVVLEYLVEVTYPFSPEIGSTICWTGGQLFGAIFIIVQNALKGSEDASPPLNMKRSLIFSAVITCVAAPFPMCIGLFGRDVRRRRLEVDRGVGLQDSGKGNDAAPPGTEGDDKEVEVGRTEPK